MLRRCVLPIIPIIKRQQRMHSFTKVKCYESIHKIDSLKEDIRELKEIVDSYHEHIMVIYSTSIISFTGTVILLIKNFF
jgi:hypothetical protein